MSEVPIQGILLDIEGTTSSIMFVHEVMFPYVLERLDSFLAQHSQRADVIAAGEQIAHDAGHESLAAWQKQVSTASDWTELVAVEVRRLMANDAKATGLKALQGLIWHGGFSSGELKAHVYSDVLPSIRRWKAAGYDVRIYSSGSITAQKLFFGHVEGSGDCLHLFSGHYDTTIGGKKDAESYRRLAADWGLPCDSILFISDIAEELTAARAAGLQVRASIRPGNTKLPDDFDVPAIASFAELN